MTEEKNSSPESQEEQPKFNQEQYDMLMRCSEKKDMTEWNEWRKNNRPEKIWLQGANLDFANLQAANLRFAKLQEANLCEANLQGANLRYAELQGAYLEDANLQGAELTDANLQGAYLGEIKLQGARLFAANLQDAKLQFAELQGANLDFANLQGVNLWGSELQGAKFTGAIVNGSTYFLGCKIDKNTDFRETALENACIEPGTKILLKYNIRRMNWKDWYKEHKFLQWPVKLFWSMSNYGISTGRIIAWFFALALFFAAVYSNLAYWWDIQAIGGSGEGFTVEPHLPLWHYCALTILRPVYFSVVTMTTLGFGDMFANAQSIWGHILLTLQVILGYVLLGALITRLAVLFTSDGPAGEFTPMDKETKKLLAKLKEDKKKAK